MYDKYGEYAGKQDETILGEFFAGIKHLGVVGNKLQTKIDFTQQSCLSGNDYIDETPICVLRSQMKEIQKDEEEKLKENGDVSNTHVVPIHTAPVPLVEKVDDPEDSVF